MKTNSFLCPCAVGLALFAGALAAPLAQAKPKFVTRTNTLEIWPGQRTLIVLPLTVADDFLTSDGATTGGAGSSALATALVPLLSPQLSSSLEGTGKFSISRPYKFDPLLRRALLGGDLKDVDADSFVLSPSRVNAQDVLSKLRLDQPGMVAQLVLQSLRVGGTSDAPTVQLTMRGDMYEAALTGADIGSAEPLRSITVTSKPFGGKTPEDRLRGAAGEAFGDIARAFVEPPVEFDLPLPTAKAPAPDTLTGAAPGGTKTPAVPMGDLPAQSPGGDAMKPMKPAKPMAPVMPITPVMPMAPAMPMAPNGTGAANAPIAPQLPASTPPLGVNVPEGT